MEDESSLDRITLHWLPFIRNSISSDQRKPVVLVGNKIDLVEYSTIDVSLMKVTKEFNYLLLYFFLASPINNGRLSRG